MWHSLWGCTAYARAVSLLSAVVPLQQEGMSFATVEEMAFSCKENFRNHGRVIMGVAVDAIRG